ncbi:thioredoxin-like protein [Heterobasidion irregulare TC 32-1]|uniref:Thioredoxin-like protein n=1 Tax=Heterobasidion irregulare (strain TC 32-1) TaxID=747525 RepID=W4KIV6_HETIT|nr:thioredoxin-like protein [Heterobasidion irregulare TC 32-1]ETW85649.1 thioredoxin-like protein [Heterobasidion irregulare TC 32-1]
MTTITDIQSKAQLDALLEQRKDSLVVIDFHATWCGPCHAIAPRFNELSREFTSAAFVRVDVDQVPEVAQQYSVSAMPTFLFIRNKGVVATLKGAMPKQLEDLVLAHSQAPAAASSSAAAASSSSGSNGASSDPSLLEHLDLSQVNCLNEAATHTLKGIVSQKKFNTTKEFLLSDADEQLLLNIEFNQVVRVRSIVIQSSILAQAPKSIKLFVNRPSLGFDDVEDAQEPEAAQVLELTEEQVKEGKPIQLRFVRFQAVNSLHIFVASNQGGEDETRIDAVDVFGILSGVTRDLSGLRKTDD